MLVPRFEWPALCNQVCTRSRSPYDLFREAHWDPEVSAVIGTDAHKTELARIIALWQAADKQVWVAQAENEKNAVSQA